MPEIVEELKHGLTHKLGPLPVWAWGGIGIGGLAVLGKLGAGKGPSSIYSPGEPFGGGPTDLPSGDPGLSDLGSIVGGASPAGQNAPLLTSFDAPAPLPTTQPSSDLFAPTYTPPIEPMQTQPVTTPTQPVTTPTQPLTTPGLTVTVPFIGDVRIPAIPFLAPPSEIRIPGPPPRPGFVSIGDQFLDLRPPTTSETGKSPTGEPLHITNPGDIAARLGVKKIGYIPSTDYLAANDSANPVENVARFVNGVATIPGAEGSYQGETLQDIKATSDRIVAENANVRSAIESASVPAAERPYLVVGEGGTLIGLSDAAIARLGGKAAFGQ